MPSMRKLFSKNGSNTIESATGADSSSVPDAELHMKAGEPENTLRYAPAAADDSTVQKSERPGDVAAPDDGISMVAAAESAAAAHEHGTKLHQLVHSRKQNSVDRETAAAALYGLSSPKPKSMINRSRPQTPPARSPQPQSPVHTTENEQADSSTSMVGGRAYPSDRGYGSAPSSPRKADATGQHSPDPSFLKAPSKKLETETGDIGRARDEQVVWEGEEVSAAKASELLSSPQSPRSLDQYKTPMVLPPVEDPSLAAAKTPVDHVHHTVLTSSLSTGSTIIKEGTGSAEVIGTYGQMEAIKGKDVLREPGYASTLAPEVKDKAFPTFSGEESLDTGLAEDVRKAATRPLLPEEEMLSGKGPGSALLEATSSVDSTISEPSTSGRSTAASAVTSTTDSLANISPKLGQRKEAPAPFGSVQELALPPIKERESYLQQGVVAEGSSGLQTAAPEDQKAGLQRSTNNLWQEHKASESVLPEATLGSSEQPILKPPPSSPARRPVTPAGAPVSPRATRSEEVLPLEKVPAEEIVANRPQPIVQGVVGMVPVPLDTPVPGGMRYSPKAMKEAAVEQAHEDRVLAQIRAWEEAENAKYLAHYQSEVRKASAYEEERRAKADADYHKKEQKLRAKYEEQRQKKYAKAHKKAESLKAVAEEKRCQREATAREKAQRYFAKGALPKKVCGCFGGV